MSSIRDHPSLTKELGPITVGQAVAIVLAIVISIMLLCINGTATQPLMWLIIAIILYMFPHLFGATPKTKAVYPLVFAVLAILIGGFAVGPAYVDENSSEHLTGNDLTVDLVPSGDDLTVTASYDGSEPRTTGMVLAYCEVNYISFSSERLSENVDGFTLFPLSDGIPGTVTLDASKLYFLVVGFLDGEGHLDTDTISHATLTGFQCKDDSGYTLLGAVAAVAFILLIVYLILILSTLLRRRLSSTRKKMEEEGRLYPQGYGRCNFCGAIVLPGQINCSKCGAYIDRPESMKPHKKDYFVCGNCGCEVSAGMTECPKCGTKFDGEENVVVHKDGTTDVSTESVFCRGCGRKIPSNSERCPYCGKERK